LLVAALLFGCKESTLLPERYGAIDGQVVDFSTGAPLANAAVTTSPPSSALVTDGNGRFRIDPLLVGNYTITVARDGYQTNTATVAVQDGQDTQATILLRAEPEDDDTTSAAMDVSVLNFVNDVQGDSTVVRVQYRVANTGSEAIPAYEVYFRIVTDGPVPFFQEQSGANLGVGQVDIAEFSRYIFSETASDVVIDDIWFEGQPAAADASPALRYPSHPASHASSGIAKSTISAIMTHVTGRRPGRGTGNS